MPEVAEVRRYVEALNQHVIDKSMCGIEVVSGRYVKTHPENIMEFGSVLPRKISKVDCKGKFIYFLTDTSWNIWSTLGLTGSWTANPTEHYRVIFYFADQDPIYFNDMRNFGTLKFVPNQEKLRAKLETLGPDILVDPCPDEIFKQKLKNKANKTLPEILMDQSVVSGIGNYIKAEALYLSQLSPHRTAGSLTDSEIFKLNQAIQAIAKESYRSGGSTFRTYADFNGEVGNFSERFMVYGRKQDPLGHPVIREETKDKRTTHWVPEIQK